MQKANSYFFLSEVKDGVLASLSNVKGDFTELHFTEEKNRYKNNLYIEVRKVDNNLYTVEYYSVWEFSSIMQEASLPMKGELVAGVITAIVNDNFYFTK